MIPELSYELYRIDEELLERRLEHRRMALNSGRLVARRAVWPRLLPGRAPRVRLARTVRGTVGDVMCCVPA